MLRNVIAIANGKGGVGKTTIAANVAGTTALSGWRVLAVDLDPQGNLGADLGLNQRGLSDGGAALAAAVLTGVAVQPRLDVRTGLDVVAGGEQTDELAAILATRHERTGDAVGDLERALAPVAGDYQLILLDCPPAGGIMLDAALAAARFLVIPTKRDAGSLDGLQRVARRFAAVRANANRDLELLAVVLFDFAVTDTRMLRETRAALQADLDGAAPVLEAFVRHNRKASADMRQTGLLAYEYEQAAEAAEPWHVNRAAPRFSSAAGPLAADYQCLTEELLGLFRRRLAAGSGDQVPGVRP